MARAPIRRTGRAVSRLVPLVVIGKSIVADDIPDVDLAVVGHIRLDLLPVDQ